MALVQGGRCGQEPLGAMLVELFHQSKPSILAWSCGGENLIHGHWHRLQIVNSPVSGNQHGTKSSGHASQIG